MLEKILRILGDYGYSVEFTSGDFTSSDRLYLYRSGKEEFIGSISDLSGDSTWKTVIELVVQALSKLENPGFELDGEEDSPGAIKKLCDLPDLEDESTRSLKSYTKKNRNKK